MFSQSIMHVDEYYNDEDRGEEEGQDNRIVVSFQRVSSSPSRQESQSDGDIGS